MISRLQMTTRVAIFAALVFIFSYVSVFIANVNPAFFIVFAAGFIWGAGPGIGVGVIGFFLWSLFNPFGPVVFPLLISQLLGISFSAIIGAVVGKVITPDKFTAKISLWLITAGFLSGLFYHIFVDVVDAWMYQPFWPRLIGGAVFSLITIISNCIIFPLFYPALAYLYAREKKK
ncbi:membrane hypothetical protein [Candidatus Zixiibacteriota bacterium]|nr:membrane hypothetical protein [candidate division Zixibacteria bacterium]